jgi:hypothetical protein
MKREKPGKGSGAKGKVTATALVQEKVVEKWKTREHPPSEFDFNFFSDEDFAQILISLGIDENMDYGPDMKRHFMTKMREWREGRVKNEGQNEGAVQLI